MTTFGTMLLTSALLAGALFAATHGYCAEGEPTPAVDGAGTGTHRGGDPSLGPADGADLPPTDLDRVKPGDLAPDFTLEDQNGRPVTLSAFRGHRPVVLVFYRGHW